MGHRLSCIGFDEIPLSDTIELTMECSQQKQRLKVNTAQQEIFYKWDLGEQMNLVVLIQEFSKGPSRKKYVKNIYPSYEKLNVMRMYVSQVEKDEGSREMILRGSVLNMPLTVSLSNVYEVTARQFTTKQYMPLSVTGLSYYGKVKKDKIGPEDVEDGIEYLLQDNGYIYSITQEEPVQMMEKCDHFVYGKILEFQEFENHFTGEGVVALTLDLGKCLLPVLVAKQDLELKDELREGYFFEGLVWLQGTILNKRKEMKKSEIDPNQVLDVVAVENRSKIMQKMWRENVFYLHPEPIEVVVKKEEKYYLYSKEGQLESISLTSEELNRYIEKYNYIWVDFKIPYQSIVLQDDKGKIYVEYQKERWVPKIRYLEHYINMGNLMYRNEEYKKAVESYSKALEFNQYYLTAYLHRAVANEALKQYHQAILDYTKIMEITPQNLEIQRRIEILKQDAEK